MNNILERYYQLVLKDRKYLEKYILNETTENEIENIIKKQTEECFIWRKVDSYEKLESIVKSNEAMELTRIGDYYFDKMCELLDNYLGIDFTELTDNEFDHILSNDNLNKILKNENAPKQLKDCIEIEEESEKISREMYRYLEKNETNAKKRIKTELEGINLGK